MAWPFPEYYVSLPLFCLLLPFFEPGSVAGMFA